MSELSVFRRGVVEAVFILVGILGAFGIDAWWDGRGEQKLERDLLTGLAAEADLNRAGLDATLGFIDAWGAKSDYFLQSSDIDLLSIEVDSVRLMVTSLTRAATFDPLDAALTLYLGTPLTGQPGAARIRGLAAGWNTELTDAEEDRTRLLQSSQAAERVVASYLLDEPRYDFLQNIRSDPELLASLRRDPEFVQAVLLRLDNQLQYRRELLQASRVLDSLRASLTESIWAR